MRSACMSARQTCTRACWLQRTSRACLALWRWTRRRRSSWLGSRALAPSTTVTGTEWLASTSTGRGMGYLSTAGFTNGPRTAGRTIRTTWWKNWTCSEPNAEDIRETRLQEQHGILHVCVFKRSCSLIFFSFCLMIAKRSPAMEKIQIQGLSLCFTY